MVVCADAIVIRYHHHLKRGVKRGAEPPASQPGEPKGSIGNQQAAGGRRGRVV